MLSRDTGTSLTRFGTCTACVRGILKNQVRTSDSASVIGFGSRVEVIVPPTEMAGNGRKQLETRLNGVQPETAGGTCFFDAVAKSLQLLSATRCSSKWLVCLTDGDDLGSRPENSQGQVVTKMLAEKGLGDLNVIMITVGQLKDQNVQLINSWVSQVSATGGVGRHLSERNAAAIASAFEVVAEFLDAEVGGATEC
mmetsp:Transcript_94741/g.263187  ORF Transcript_94741/g.263187 Transcript_94741/m.263187 type:complete len:196 (+) Transcript_94741:3-590(+)